MLWDYSSFACLSAPSLVCRAACSASTACALCAACSSQPKGFFLPACWRKYEFSSFFQMTSTVLYNKKLLGAELVSRITSVMWYPEKHQLLWFSQKIFHNNSPNFLKYYHFIMFNLRVNRADFSRNEGLWASANTQPKEQILQWWDCCRFNMAFVSS